MTLADTLMEAVRAGDAAACVRALSTASEAERASAAVTMRAALEAARFRNEKRSLSLLGLDAVDGRLRRAIGDAAATAALGTVGDVASLRPFGLRGVPPDDAARAVLRDRRPPWTGEWAALVCELAPRRWELARSLVRAGLCATPRSEAYSLGLVWAAAHRASPRHTAYGGVAPTPLFEEDPALLDDDVWRVFEVEGDEDISLTGHERYWSPALLDLVAKGRLDRGRLLDATLDAMGRDFAQHKAGFFSRLHDALRPTPTELTARAGRYLALLASGTPPTVQLAARALKAASGHGHLDAAALVRAAPMARSARGREASLTLLALLGAVRGAERPAALRSAAAFVEHEAMEVVDAALDLLDTAPPDPALLARVEAAAPVVAASRQERLSRWLSSRRAGAPAPPAEPPTSPAAAPPARRAADDVDVARASIAALSAAAPTGPWPRVALDDLTNPAPRVDPARRVAPIASRAELLDALVRAVEEPDDRVTFERMLDGLSRLGAPLSAFPAERLTALLKRLPRTRTTAGWYAAKWLAAEAPTVDATPGAVAFGERRLARVVARLAEGRVQPLLSMPSTDRFFVAPWALVERAREVAAGPLDVTDAVCALLRLAPDGRAEALRDARSLEGPLAGPLRHALGDDVTPGADAVAALWIAAARARCPGATDPVVARAFPGAGPDAGEAARFSFVWRVERRAPEGAWEKVDALGAVSRAYLEVTVEPPAPPAEDAEHLAVSLATPSGAPFSSVTELRELVTLAPVDPRSLLALGARRVAQNVDWFSAEWANHLFIEALLDPDLPLGPEGTALLAIALNAKEARESAHACDAAIAAIADGRVVGPELGAAMRFFCARAHDEALYGRAPTFARWARSLATVAEASALHGEVVRRALEALFAEPPARVPSDAHSLLQVWLDRCAEASTGVSAEARRTLTALGLGGKAKAIVRALLAREPAPSAMAEEAHRLAIEGRWQRAERWTRWRRDRARGIGAAGPAPAR